MFCLDLHIIKILKIVLQKNSSMASTSPMASSSSVIPSTSALAEITGAEENTKQNQNTLPPTVNDTENGIKPASKPLPQHQNKKKSTPFSYLSKWRLGETKHTKENIPSPEEVSRKSEEIAKKRKEETDKEIEAISSSILADFHSIENASERIKKHEATFKEATEKFKEIQKHANAKDLREFKKVVKTLKHQMSSTQDKKGDDKEEEAMLSKLRAISVANAQEAVDPLMMPNLFADPDFKKTLQFQDFKARYNELPLELKLCLLCFSVFPENVDIKRRVLVYWWIGEGFVPPRKLRPEESPENQHHWDKFNLMKINPSETEFTPERWANHYFKMLLSMGFIESAQKKPNPKVDVVKMHPFVRSMVNRIAKKAEFFEFDGDGAVNEKFSKSLRACLTLKEDDKEVDKEDDKKVDKEEYDMLLKNLHAILNVDEAILNFKRDSLSKMRNAYVLYLGRWQSLGTHHIEVDDTKILDANKGNILDGLQNIKNLKFLSLQGISRITELPKSILKLQNLTILDIRACHNLETISNDIGCLVNLTHLDMSECYLLDEMPKGISLLTKLQVLSGFVVLESANKKSCTLVDLKGFPHLRKLSIHTGSDKFPLEKDLRALNQFQKLSKLTIAWGRATVKTQRITLDKSTSLPEQNEEESKNGCIDIGEQGNDKVNSGKEQTSKKENSGESRKEAGSGNQETDQTPETDNLEEIKKENILQTQKESEGSQVLMSEIEEASSRSTQGASTSTSKRVAFSVDTVQKDLEKNKAKALSREAKPPEQKPDLAATFKDLLDRGLESKLIKKLTSKRIEHVPAELPSHLTKLDLQSLPETTQNWLRPDKLLGLKKLYIRGGKLSDLGQFHGLGDSPRKQTWEEVTELRLKYLDEVEMEWKELLELFPKLVYLEKVDCPKLSFFPCDEIGVWTKKKTDSR